MSNRQHTFSSYSAVYKETSNPSRAVKTTKKWLQGLPWLDASGERPEISYGFPISEAKQVRFTQAQRISSIILETQKE